MKKDKLEQFILDHRDDFDEFEPGSELFNKIVPENSKEIDLKPKKFQLNTFLYRAASVLVIISLSVLSTLYIQNSYNKYTKSENIIQSESDYSFTSDLQEAESYYQLKIQQRRSEFISLAKSNPQVAIDIANEYASLDSAFIQLKKELRQNINNEQIIEAMIQNYKLKLELLEDILSQLKQNHSNKKTQEELKYEI